MMTTTTVAAMQQQQGVRLHVDESDMLIVGGWLVLGNWNCLSPSDCLKWFQEDLVVSTCGNKHCASGEERHGGKGKVWKSEDSFLFRHFPSYAALAAPQDGCDGLVWL